MKGRPLFAIGALLLPMGMTRADEAALPGPGFEASHYQLLWTKSPFTVESPGEAPATTDYSLVGIAEFDGVSYASLIDKSNNEHFLLASDRPARGLSLVSLNHGQKPDDATAVILKNGQQMTLKLDTTSAAVPPAAQQTAMNQPPMPGIAPLQMQMPGAGRQMPGALSGVQVPPPAFIRRTLIHVPPPPNGTSGISAPPASPQPLQPPPAPNGNPPR